MRQDLATFTDSWFNFLLYFSFFSVRSIMQKYLDKTGESAFEKIFIQKLGKIKICLTCKLVLKKIVEREMEVG